MMNKTSKALKKLLCAALITGIVLTGFPATLWHSAYGNITHAEAAETTEEQWKTDIKNALDKQLLMMINMQVKAYISWT